MNSELEIIQLIVQTGAVGISLFLIWYIDRRDRRQLEEDLLREKTLRNHLKHDEAAKRAVAKALRSLEKIMVEVRDLLKKANGKGR